MKFAVAVYNAGLRCYETAASLLYSTLRFRRRGRFAFNLDSGDRREALVIAMNGPTLADDLARVDASIGTDVDFAVANHFADTEFFVARRPGHYFFSDPYFWDDGAERSLINKRKATFESIATKTHWPMRIYYPIHSNPTPFSEQFSGHGKITLHPFNAAALPTDSNVLLQLAWRRGVCAPYGQNVLIHAIYGAIQLGYSRIGIAGAGFSFHEQIHVDQYDNTFMKRRRHIYGESTERAYVDQRKTKPASVATEFKALHNAFRSLEAVAVYARRNGCKVVNYSEYSYLDMFCRPNEGTNLKAQE
nr:hypothetical protein [uncultured Celeribacter sp.]